MPAEPTPSPSVQAQMKQEAQAALGVIDTNMCQVLDADVDEVARSIFALYEYGKVLYLKTQNGS